MPRTSVVCIFGTEYQDRQGEHTDSLVSQGDRARKPQDRRHYDNADTSDCNRGGQMKMADREHNPLFCLSG